ncbi:cytochrome P450 [Pseudonocardia sediminis]|uniref:cytochrome P450 n=1 Tax=Pseudonocardia sediminis TaxID=1397368 RepID=UPI001F5EAA1C|nr:cytochrome P450 [Pseudonocardia sediminis]
MHAFDPADPAFLADPYPAYARMRAVAAVHEHPSLGLPVAVSHAACSDVLRDRGLGRIWTDAAPAADFAAFNLLHRNSLLEREGEPHTRLRRLVATAFGRGHTARLAPWVQRRADALVDGLVERIDEGCGGGGDDGDGADLISGVAEPLPVEVIAELLGVPESERGPLRGWSDAIVRMYEPDPGDDGRASAERASAEFVAQLRALAARPAGGHDLVSDLLAVRDADGARISGDELVGTAALLLMAGHEATVNVIGNGVRALLDHPDQWARLVAGPGLVPAAVEELIRFDAPLQLFERTALRDTEVAGFPVAAGASVGALLGAAARDPEAFADPDRLDVGRSPNPHLGFGAGVHYCLGAPLARVEIAATLHALRERLPDMALAGTPSRRPRFVMRGYQRLLIRRAER